MSIPRSASRHGAGMPLTPARRPAIPPAHLDLVRPGNLAGDMELIRDAQRVADEQAKDSSLDAVASMLHRAAHPSVRTQVHWFDFTCWNSYHRGMKSVISEKGQVTIPKPVRDKLGLRPGTEMEFEAVGGRLVGHKAVSADPFAKWRGRGELPKGRTVDGYLKEIRGADGD